MKLECFSLIFVMSVVVAQKPTPCTTPPQWSARFMEYNRADGTFFQGRISYDSIYKRERTIEEVQLGKNQTFYDILRIYNSKTEYALDIVAKTCITRPLTRDWRDFGIPQNGTFYGESYIGAAAVPNANLLTTIWGATFTDSKGNEIDYLGTWTLNACLPVSSRYYSKADNLATHGSFFDIIPGISDPNVFIPPRECQ